MSFGLLNELVTLIGGPDNVAAIVGDPELREAVLFAALSERSKTGKVTKAVTDIFDVEISTEDAESVLEWVMANAIAFFMRSLKRVVKVVEPHKATIEELASSPNG